jgi:putative transposase
LPGPQPTPIVLSDRQRSVLERLVRRQTNPQRLVRRAKFILEMASGTNNAQVARCLKHTRKVATLWRQRWLEAAPTLVAAEAESKQGKALGELVEAALADEHRSGAPSKFTSEQIVHIIALACEEPAASGRAISHWTPRELAEEVVKRGIVESISARSVGRFLARWL